MTTDMKRPTQQDQPRSLMARGIDALSRREYSRKELREKLVQALEAGQSASEVDAVLDELESKKYLSNEATPEAVCECEAPAMAIDVWHTNWP